jgi:hypothetical protein
MKYDHWCSLSADNLAKQDIGRINLTAAWGLPGPCKFDIDEYDRMLDAWATAYRRGLDRYWPRRRRPENCGYTDGQFKILILFTVLQRDLGVHYEPFCMGEDYDARDARYEFIIGQLQGVGGTCASLPVLFATVGRRAGLPLHLALAKEHVYVRWDGDGEEFEIEATSQGYRALRKGHYLMEPRPLTAHDLAKGIYLRNMTPPEVLALFIHQRGRCLLDNLRFDAAIEAFKHAARLEPVYEGDWIAAEMERHLWQAIGKAGKRVASWEQTIDLVSPMPWTAVEQWAIRTAKYDLLRILRNVENREFPPERPLSGDSSCTTREPASG